MSRSPELLRATCLRAPRHGTWSAAKGPAQICPKSLFVSSEWHVLSGHKFIDRSYNMETYILRLESKPTNIRLLWDCENHNMHVWKRIWKKQHVNLSQYEFSVVKIAPASADNSPTLKNESLLHTAIDPIRFSFFAKGHKASCGTAGNEHLYTPLSFRCKGHTVAETCHKLPTSTKYIGIRVGPLSSTIRRSLAKREFLIIKQLWPYQLT